MPLGYRPGCTTDPVYMNDFVEAVQEFQAVHTYLFEDETVVLPSDDGTEFVFDCRHMTSGARKGRTVINAEVN